MDRLRDRLLSIVVIDLDGIEILEVRQLVEQEVDEVLAHCGRGSVEIAVLLRLERDARVAHRHVAEEDSERREETLPVGGGPCSRSRRGRSAAGRHGTGCRADPSRRANARAGECSWTRPRPARGARV